MLAKLKLFGYVVLTILAIWFAIGLYINYSAVTMTVPTDIDPDAVIAAQSTNADGTPVDASATNIVANSDNNTVDTNVLADTADSATNSDATVDTDSTNNPASVESAKVTKANPASTTKKHKKSHVVVNSQESARAAAAENRTAMMKYLGALVLTAVGLGILIAYDATRYVAHRGIDALFDDDGPAGKDPAYERAEQIWADGKPIEAIEAMREYLKKNPREQYVALRIAEIYEKDLKNILAASLEIEEVLKHKLHPDRWGWTAIHLCNLYSKMGKQDKYDALLHRIVDEYPKTSAAIKARKVLGLPEEDALPTPAAPITHVAPPPSESKTPVAENGPKSNLPPGFRPK